MAAPDRTTVASGPPVAMLTARRAARSGVVWGYVFGLYVVSSALGYASAYKTPAARAGFAAAFEHSVALSALIGPAHRLATVAGFTVWRCLGVFSVVGAVWGLLTATRLLRGEEDQGRWEPLLAGPTTRRAATGRALLGLGAGWLALLVPAAVLSVAVGRAHSVRMPAGAALWLSVGAVLPAAVFLAAGALTSQLAGSRRQAAAWAAAGLGAAYAVRMVADSGTGLAWLRWVTPLGWVEELRPGSDPRPLLLLPVAALTAALATAAWWLAGRRDVGAGLLPDRPARTPRLALLGGATALAVRLARGSVVGWAAGVVAGGLLVGDVARSAGETARAGSSLARVLARLGATRAGATGYLAVGTFTLAVLVGLLAAGLVGAARAEEADGRLEHLLARPLARCRWLAGRLGVAAAAAVATGVAGGAAMWAGAAAQHTRVSAGSLLAAGISSCGPALAVLGAGALLLGVRPRLAAPAAYAVVTWGVLVDLLAGVTRLNHLLLDTSVFRQMGAAPSAAVPWPAWAGLAGVGLAAAAVGLVAFSRRDLAGA